MAVIQLIIAILAAYRLAHLLPEDDGPFFIFKRIRYYVNHKMIAENNDWGFWSMVYEGINCVYCMGLYTGIFCGLIMMINNHYSNIFLVIMAIAGGQSLLQRISTK